MRNLLQTLLLYFLRVYGVIEVFGEGRSETIVNFVMSTPNTVQFITADFCGLDRTGKWVKIDDKNVQIVLDIYLNKVSRTTYIMPSTKGNQFYTTPEKGKYYFLYSVKGIDHLRDKYSVFGLQTSIFSGEPSLPVVRSSGEVELDRAEAFIKQILDYVKQNFTIISMDFDDDENFKGIYDGIMKTAMFMMILKLAATIFTSYYSSIKTKAFYKAQNLK